MLLDIRARDMTDMCHASLTGRLTRDLTCRKLDKPEWLPPQLPDWMDNAQRWRVSASASMMVSVRVPVTFDCSRTAGPRIETRPTPSTAGCGTYRGHGDSYHFMYLIVLYFTGPPFPPSPVPCPFTPNPGPRDADE